MPGVIISLVLSSLLLVLVVIFIIFSLRFKRVYLFSVHSHGVKVELKAGGIFLYVDGTLEEQASGQRIRFLTLHALIDGEEFKVHLTARGFHPQVQATHGGREVPCIGVTK